MNLTVFASFMGLLAVHMIVFYFGLFYLMYTDQIGKKHQRFICLFSLFLFAITVGGIFKYSQEIGCVWFLSGFSLSNLILWACLFFEKGAVINNEKLYKLFKKKIINNKSAHKEHFGIALGMTDKQIEKVENYVRDLVKEKSTHSALIINVVNTEVLTDIEKIMALSIYQIILKDMHTQEILGAFLHSMMKPDK
jgi:hypothetical protein